MSLESQRKWLHLALAPEMDFENFYRLLKTFGLPENIFSQTFSALSVKIQIKEEVYER